MSDYDRDRGAYSPTGEAPLAFDARDPSGRGAGRPPTTLIVSGLVLLIAVLGVMFWYRDGPRRAGQPPVVGQPLSDIRQQPPASAQPADEAAGLQIYGAGKEPAPSAAPPAFGPPPEEPLRRATEPAPSPSPAPAASPAAAQAAQPAVPEHPAQTAQLQPQTASPPPVRPAPAAPTPAPPTPVQAATQPGMAMVQIGAFSSPALADKGWGDVARILPGQMVGRTKKVETFVKGDQTFFRAYVGGFGSRAEAAAFCSDLTAAGHACFVK
jgi:cell division protein FtsN